MTKGETETYEWISGNCPAAQYSKEFGNEYFGLSLEWINNLAQPAPHTFGALTERMEKAYG
jgi:hypothetical protein